MFIRKIIFNTLNSINRQHKRNFGEWLQKNIRVEENGGLREHTLHTFQFTLPVLARLTLGLFLPLVLIYNGIVYEFVSL